MAGWVHIRSFHLGFQRCHHRPLELPAGFVLRVRALPPNLEELIITPDVEILCPVAERVAVVEVDEFPGWDSDDDEAALEDMQPGLLF